MVLSERPLEAVLEDSRAHGFVFFADDKPFAQLDLFDSVFTLSWLSTGDLPDAYLLAETLSIVSRYRAGPRVGFLSAAAPSSLEIRIARTEGSSHEYSSRELDFDRLSPSALGMILDEPRQLAYTGNLLSLDMIARRGRGPGWQDEPWLALWADTYQRTKYPEVGMTLDYRLRELWGIDTLFRKSIGAHLDDDTEQRFLIRINEALGL